MSVNQNNILAALAASHLGTTVEDNVRVLGFYCFAFESRSHLDEGDRIRYFGDPLDGIPRDGTIRCCVFVGYQAVYNQPSPNCFL